MEISGIAKYLEQYKAKLFAHDDLILLIQRSIQEVTGVTIPLTAVQVDRSVIKVQVDPVIKHHLFMYQKQILELLHTRTKRVFTEIRS